MHSALALFELHGPKEPGKPPDVIWSIQRDLNGYHVTIYPSSSKISMLSFDQAPRL